MAKRSKSEEPEIPPSIPSDQAIGLLKRQIEKANEELAHRPIDLSQHEAWTNTTRELLIRCFGSRSHNIGKVIYASGGPMRFGMSKQEADNSEAEKIQNQIQMLNSCVAQLELLAPLKQSSAQDIAQSDQPQLNDKVFIVHGHNDAVKLMVSQTIEKLGLRPIILHEQANQGMTLIEKLARHANTGFAIVILTADDLGKTSKDDTLRQRARQNVIFEFGFFEGRLGRDRVCALYEKGVEIPTDLDGLVYTVLDEAGRWKFDLAKELKAAGYSIEANNIL